MPNNSWMVKALTLAANVLRNNAVAITSVRGAGGYPPQIPAGMRVDPATVTDDYGRITVSTSNKGTKSKERNADITIAFEKGSGLTGPKRQRYLIEPTEGKKVLRFPWPEASNIVGRKGIPTTELVKATSSTGETVYLGGEANLPYVMHPGIRPRPFLQKGLDASEDELDAIILGEFEDYLVEILP